MNEKTRSNTVFKSPCIVFEGGENVFFFSLSYAIGEGKEIKA